MLSYHNMRNRRAVSLCAPAEFRLAGLDRQQRVTDVIYIPSIMMNYASTWNMLCVCNLQIELMWITRSSCDQMGTLSYVSKGIDNLSMVAVSMGDIWVSQIERDGIGKLCSWLLFICMLKIFSLCKRCSCCWFRLSRRGMRVRCPRLRLHWLPQWKQIILQT